MSLPEDREVEEALQARWGGMAAEHHDARRRSWRLDVGGYEVLLGIWWNGGVLLQIWSPCGDPLVSERGSGHKWREVLARLNRHLPDPP